MSTLKLASGRALGHGGVFVVQSPYLLFYADQNRDDVPVFADTPTPAEVTPTGQGFEKRQ